MTKMTDEEIREARSWAYWTDDDRDRVFAHIAALTKERDEAQTHLAEANATKGDMLRGLSKDTVAVLNLAGSLGCGPDDVWEAATELRRRAEEGEALNTRQERELDTLRERVRMLEAEVALMKERATNSEKGRERAREANAALQTRLAAIRQRAGDQDGLRRMAEVCAIMGSASSEWDDAVHDDVVMRGLESMLHDVADGLARHILADDAPAPEETGALPDAECSPCSSGAPCAMHHKSEPSTAEALTPEQVEADVEGALLGYVRCGQRLAKYISLLERRMGAMGRALRGCRTHLKCTEGCACDVCAALVGASAVPTLDEAEERAREVYEAAIARREHQPVALSLAVREAVLLAPSGTVSASGPCGCGHPACTAPALTDAPDVFTREEVERAMDEVWTRANAYEPCDSGESSERRGMLRMRSAALVALDALRKK